MSNIQDLRTRLRTDRGFKPPSSGMAFRIVAALMICAVVSGAVYYAFLKPRAGPVLVPLRPSASIPTFRQVTAQDQTPQSPVAPSGESRVQSDTAQPAARYTGLSYRQIGNVADEVCFARAHARFPHWSKTPRLTTKELHDFSLDEMPHFNELMHCLLTEAPTRYCSSSQRSMITAEVAMYFRGLDHGNKMLAQHRADMVAPPGPGRLERTFPLDVSELNRINRLEFIADSRIIAAIEARLHDGTLTKTDLEAFGKAAPPLRQRLANLKPSTPACPNQPWWAFWRTL